MLDDDRPVTRAELLPMFRRLSESLLETVLELVGAPAAAAAVKRHRTGDGVDPTFAAQRAAVRKAMDAGAHLTMGADVGRRTGPGVYKLSEASDEDGEAGPALRAIRRRLRRGR